MNPLTHVGQTAHPEGDGQTLTQQQQQQQGGQARSDQEPPSWNPPATRLPQHPQQQQEDPAHSEIGRQRIHQQGETRAEDTTLPAPTQAD